MVFKWPEPIKSILLKLISHSFKEINWRLSHKLFSKLFKTTKSFWCFVFVTLFNLQGAHRANLSRRILMIAHRFSFVKSFFQVFSNFFSSFIRRFAALSLVRLSQTTWLGYHKHFALSSTFFKFSKLFSAPDSALHLSSPHFSRRFLPSRKALAYISKHFPLCQHLFSVFFVFLFSIRTPAPSEKTCIPPCIVLLCL